MRSFSAALVFSLPTLHHNKMFPLYLRSSQRNYYRLALVLRKGINIVLLVVLKSSFLFFFRRVSHTSFSSSRVGKNCF
jgi:hypothetical protein